MEPFLEWEACMQHVTPRRFFKDVAITWALALAVGLGVGGAAAGVVLILSTAGL